VAGRQIIPFGVPWAAVLVDEHMGGSARGYEERFASLAIPAQTDKQMASPYFYTSQRSA
jgi:hypothetical protein